MADRMIQTTTSRTMCGRSASSMWKALMLADDQLAAHIADRRHGTTVSEERSRGTGDKALPAIDPRTFGLEGKRDDVLRAGRRGVAHPQQWDEDAQIGDREGMGRHGGIDRVQVPFLRVPLVVEILDVHGAALDAERLSPEWVSQATGAVLLVDLNLDGRVGRHMPGGGW